jgi:hypothetical protein
VNNLLVINTFKSDGKDSDYYGIIAIFAARISIVYQGSQQKRTYETEL